jgi:hypothetical protein
MNRPTLRRIIPQITALVGVFVLCTAIAVAQDATTTGGTAPRTDGQIEMDVVQALDASQTLQNDLITAATIQSEVTLSGTVTDQSSSQLAESIAAKVPGVTKVRNNLKIGNPQDAQDQMAPSNADAGAPPQDNQSQAGQAPGSPAPDQNQSPDQGQYSSQGQYQPQGQYPQGQYPPQQGQYPPQQGQYPDQSQYPPARPQYQQQPYPPQQPPAPVYEPAKGPVTIAPGTLLQLRTAEGVDSKRAKDGEPVQFTVIQDVPVGGVLAIPRGAVVHGVVTYVKKVGSGDLGGASELALTLTSLDLGGRSYPLATDEFKVKGPNKTGHTVGSAIGGGLMGTIIGCAVGRGVGCAIGAGAGVAAGTAAGAASPGPNVWIPTEALVTFHLTAPLTVAPVSPQEAARLAQGLYQGGPELYRRGGPYGAQYPPPPPYGYGYPPVYYRPYYTVGGVYYWR